MPILLAALLAAAPARDPSFPFPIEQHVLANGLRVVLVTYDSPGLVAYYTLMRVGSRNEPEAGRSGYAHFFEHMMFRGTKQHSSEDYNQTVVRLGLNTNAFTSNDMTVYHLYGPKAALSTVIDYEADRFQHLDYDEAAFKTEAGAILGEYAKSASHPMQSVYEKMSETAFDKHTYRHTTIGYLADVKAMPSGYAYSREFFRRYYTPDNATLFIVGDFNHADTLAHITKAYGTWQGKLDAAVIPEEPKQQGARKAEVDWASPTQPRVWLAWHAPSAQPLSADAAQTVLGAYLFGPTSPLYQDVVLGRQIAESLGASYNTQRDPSLFGVIVTGKDEKDLPALEAAVQKEIDALKNGTVDATRFAAVRSNLKYSTIMALDTADHVAVAIAVNAAPTGEVTFLSDELKAVDKLTAADLVSFAKTYLNDDNKTVITLRGAK